jgi:hypothetical protein
MTEQTKIPKSVSAYFRKLALRANAKCLPGSPEAKARTAKAREVLRARREERKAAADV